MIPRLISKTTAFIFQRNVSKMDMSSGKRLTVLTEGEIGKVWK
jgi:hypothetical protein